MQKSTYEAVVQVMILNDQAEAERLEEPAHERVHVVRAQSRVTGHLDVDRVAIIQQIFVSLQARCRDLDPARRSPLTKE